MINSDNITLIEQPIIDFVDKILTEAVGRRASDIHIEVFEDRFVIRYRIDGSLVSVDGCSLDIAKPVCSRVKILAGLNISETRLPQDGMISYTFGDNEVDFRVSCLPTQFGESIVLRILNNAEDIFSLKNILGEEKELLGFLKNSIHKSGLTLFVGPTGCGKSTTMYGVLREINNDRIKILTCEDPVEQYIEGISQSNINSNIGFSFSCALRSFLRHDPDVIFIGEIRDSDTAELAIRAAMTGHTVFATLHANGTENTVARLVDLGIDKIMISEALTCIIHQQLVKQDKYPQTTNQNNASENLPGRVAKFDYIFVDDELRSKIKNSKF